MIVHAGACSTVATSEGDKPARLDRLGRLLEHPAIWRGRSVAHMEVVSTGFEALDEGLPGHGWPRAGLVEILISRIGVGELYLLLPALAALTRRASARWCAWISPPFEPFAPALAAHGVVLERLFVARADVFTRGRARPQSGVRAGSEHALWAFEQSLVSGACEAVLGWVREPRARDIRRLQLAAEKGRTLGVLFRPRSAAREFSSAVLRMVVEPSEQGPRVTLLKSRGGQRGFIDLEWSAPRTSQEADARSKGFQAPSPQAHGSR